MNKITTIFNQLYGQKCWHVWRGYATAIFFNFGQKVVNKAKESCKNAYQSTKNHFKDVLDMIEIGKTTSREIKDIALSRYACYLIMKNADPSKEVVALGQTYFAIQTRKQEVQLNK